MIVAGSVAGSQLAVASAAAAADLPTQLLAAARGIPADTRGLRVCLGLVEPFHGAEVRPDPGGAEGLSGSPPYSADIKGAYLGEGPAGGPAPPFVQALIDAGSVTRFALTSTRHVRVPTMFVPQLQDTGNPPSAKPFPPLYEDRTLTYRADEYVVTGPDADLFPHDGDLLAPVPPAAPIEASPDSPSNEPARRPPPPPGMWRTSHVCYRIVADRVLEYGDIVSNGNGVSQVSALLLFRPERMPSWAADLRVAENLRPAMRPLEFRLLAFRSDGDGWVVMPSAFLPLPPRTHIVGADE